jgi:hypothetical protein
MHEHILYASRRWQFARALWEGIGCLQVTFVLGELTDLSSTTVSAVMAVGRRQEQPVPGQLDCLSAFLVACLDHMAATVSLMHGRLPLSGSDEALHKISQCVSACFWTRRQRTHVAQCSL